MNRVGLLLSDLDDAELDLAQHFRQVAERQAAEHDVANLCQTLAKECIAHAEWIASLASEQSVSVARAAADRSPSPLAAAIRQMSRALGRQPESGVLLISELRTLYLQVQRVEIDWTLLLQVLKAQGDSEHLKQANQLHEETVIQGKWLRTRLKVSVPQVILVATP